MRDLHGSICVCPECERPGIDCGYCRGLYCPECASCRGVPDDDGIDDDALAAVAVMYGLADMRPILSQSSHILRTEQSISPTACAVGGAS